MYFSQATSAATDPFLIAILPALPGQPIPLVAEGSAKGLFGDVCTEPGLMHGELGNRIKPDFTEMSFERKQACLLFD